MQHARNRKADEIASEHEADEGMARFASALGNVVAVSKKELNKKHARWKNGKKQRPTQGTKSK